MIGVRGLAGASPRHEGGIGVSHLQRTALKIGAEALLARAHAPPPIGHEVAAGVRTGHGSEPEGLGSIPAAAPAETDRSSRRLGRSAFHAGTQQQAPLFQGEQSKLEEFCSLLLVRYGSLGEAWQRVLDPGRRGRVSFAELRAACLQLEWPGDALELFSQLDQDLKGYIEKTDLDGPTAQRGGRPSSRQGESEQGDESLRCFRLFLARARRGGPSGISRLAKHFWSASKSGLLDEESFVECCLAQQLGHGMQECRAIFLQLLAIMGGPQSCGATSHNRVLQAAGVMECIRGKLSPARLQVVQEVWSLLDPEGCGAVEAQTLLSLFDARWLPAVRYGEVTPEIAQREMLEGLGLNDVSKEHPCLVGNAGVAKLLALEEAWGGRRPAPFGLLGTTPRDAPAGKPRITQRARGDVAEELALQSAEPLARGRVSAGQFLAYYSAVSTAAPHDDLFIRIVQDPWRSRAAREDALSVRASHSLSRKENASSMLKILASFEDGSSRVVLLRSDTGLDAHSRRSGAGGGQTWTLGPDAIPEVTRRLQEQGIKGIKKVKLLSC